MITKLLSMSAGCLLGVIAVGCCNNSAKPAEPAKLPSKNETVTTTQPVATAIPVNMNCMVEKDDKANPAITYDYQGKTYAFCCKDCLAEFKKDPQKYLASAK